MFTIVIPTMWKYEPFLDFLPELTNHYLVEEILIIDNDSKSKPESEVLYHPKVKFIYEGENSFVNPAWNLGVKEAESEYICIMNDDILFDLRLFNKLLPHMIDEKFGVAGAHPGAEHFHQYPYKDGSIDILPWSPPEPGKSHGYLFGFGTLFFVRKSNWFTIPDSLLIYCGDDWVHFTQDTYDRNIYLITNFFYSSPSAQTCSNIMTKEEREIVLETEHKSFHEEVAIFRDQAYQGYIEGEYKLACELDTYINEHLPTLRDLAGWCESVVELGVREGWSTRAFLTQYNKFRAYDTIRWPYLEHLFTTMKNVGRDMDFIHANSLDVELEPCDMIFFNTYKDPELLKQELDLHANKANRFLVFHDYKKLLSPVIESFMEEHRKVWKIKAEYHNNNGLLILERKQWT